MKTFILNILNADGKLSSKRLVTLLAFLMMSTGFISNLFWKLTIDPVIYDSMKWIVIGGLGFTASEQFASKNGDKVKSQLGAAAIPAEPDAPVER
jgi:hypothetical protein